MPGCLFRVKLRTRGVSELCQVFPQQQTSGDCGSMSERCRFCCRSRRRRRRASGEDEAVDAVVCHLPALEADMPLGYAGPTQKHSCAAGGGRTRACRAARFWAIAANVNSNWAPLSPRKRSRPSRRMRLRWANSISTRFLSRRDCSNASVFATAGQHRGPARRGCAGFCAPAPSDSTAV